MLTETEYFASDRGAEWVGEAAGRATPPPLGLLRDAQARFVCVQLGLAAYLVCFLVPLVCDLSHRLVQADLAGEKLGERLVERRLLVEGRLGDAQVEHHVRALEA